MKKIWIALALAVAVAPLPAAAREPAPAPRASPAAKLGVPAGEVDGPTARKLVAAGVKVLDVRTPEEFQEGHVPGAVNVPFDQVARRHAELGPPSTPLLVYCRTGRRSAIAIAALRARGFTEIYDLQAYDRWVRSR